MLRSTAPWFGVFSAYDQLLSSQPFHHLGESLTSISIWVVLPTVIGLSRSLHREVK